MTDHKDGLISRSELLKLWSGIDGSAMFHPWSVIDTIKRAPAVQTVGEWISVKEKLPDHDGWYVVYIVSDSSVPVKHKKVKEVEGVYAVTIASFDCKNNKFTEIDEKFKPASDPYLRDLGFMFRARVKYWTVLPEGDDKNGYAE